MITLVAAVAAIVVSHSETNRYQATATMLFGPPSFANPPLGGGGGSLASPSSSPQDQATDLALASLDTISAGVKEKLGGPLTLNQLRGAVTVQLEGSSNLVDVTAIWGTPRAAAVIANAFADEIVAFRKQAAQAEIQQSIDAVTNTIKTQEAAVPAPSGGSPAGGSTEIQSLRSQLGQLEALKALQTGDVQIVQRATLPLSPNSPHVARNAILAGFVGLILSILLVLAMAQFDDRVQDEAGLTVLMGAPVLARIPELSRSKRLGHTAWSQQDRGFVEAFELLRLNLQLAESRQGHLVVSVTSPATGDGKTTVVASLARTLALSGADVVALDFDLRKPMLHACFNVPQESEGGVLRALLDTGGRDDLTQPTECPGLRIVTAGQHPPPPGSIAHERLRAMLGRLRDNADYVLVDTSPVSVGADASAAVAAADGVIMVIDLERIRRRDLLVAKRQLEIAGTTILGLVVNRAHADASAYRGSEPATERIRDTSPPTFIG